MKEDILRKMIRNQIKSTLTESPMMDKTRGIVTQKLGNVEKMAITAEDTYNAYEVILNNSTDNTEAKLAKINLETENNISAKDIFYQTYNPKKSIGDLICKICDPSSFK